MNKANQSFSFIVLSFNDEMHIERLFTSIQSLYANIYVLDSGSTDNTAKICSIYGATIRYHAFENHPKQWDYALQSFNITTPWVIALDADQIVSPELLALLRKFDSDEDPDLNGIYFNRKNFYKGKWIRYGGYYPFYMLKMFRFNVGFSDINENMDHRFLVPGKTKTWRNGYLLEENLKESSVQFWLDKHGRYSDLLAREEVERLMKLRTQALRPRSFGTPNERKAFRKMLWWKLPLYARPILYFLYRMILKRGFLDGRTGIIFHFLQGFWFRLIVDIKIEEILKEDKQDLLKNRIPIQARFAATFLLLFFIFYSFNMLAIGLSSPGGLYIPWLQKHADYIELWRRLTIEATAGLLYLMHFEPNTNKFGLSIYGLSGFKLVYSCLGYGIMSFYAAFILAFPKPTKAKLFMLSGGLLTIQFLNIVRLTLISIYWKPMYKHAWIDHHTWFNLTIYLLVLFMLYLWVGRNHKIEANGTHATKKEI